MLTTRSMSCLTLCSRCGRADVAAEVLADHDVGGELAPERRAPRRPSARRRSCRDSFVMLAVRNSQVDLVVRVDARRGPAALEGEAPRRRCR